MKLYVDLHIHSCLSPCADDDMTPNNIAGMASIKELDAIAVCDHNAAGNLRAIEQTCEEYGVVFLPGIECTTAEEVHLLTYFPTVDAAIEFEKAVVAPNRTLLPNRPDYWGRQVFMDAEDEETGEEPHWLIPALAVSLDELTMLCRTHGGLAVPAHINRNEYSLLNVLGFVPPGSPFAALELCSTAPAPQVDLAPYKTLYSSDAHILPNISEKSFFLECPERTRQALFETLREFEKRVTA